MSRDILLGYESTYYQRVFSLPEIENGIANYLDWLAYVEVEPEYESNDPNDWWDLLDMVFRHSEIEHERFFHTRGDYRHAVVLRNREEKTSGETEAQAAGTSI